MSVKVKVSAKDKSTLVSFKDIKEIVRYKDLLFALVKRDVGVIYKQTVLGFGWAIIRPVVQMVIFTVFFGKLAGIGDGMDSEKGGYQLFSFAALVPWTYFSTSLISSTQSLVANKDFLTKVYFPRLIIPLTPILAKLVDFILSFFVLILMMIYYGVYPSVFIVVLPVLILLMILTSFGMSLWLSALSVQYRDINQMVMFLGQLLMYLAPVIWPISYIPEKYLLLYGIYPMVGVIEGFRSVLLNSGPVQWDLIGMGFLSALFLVVSGLYFFRSKENYFADVA